MSDPSPPPQTAPDRTVDFRTAYCRWRGIDSSDFEKDVLKRTLTWNARFVKPIVRLLHPDAFHPELSLVRQAGDKIEFEDIRLDIDFYQHKHVVNSSLREFLRFRVSGTRLQRLALNAFRAVRGSGRSASPNA